MDLERPVLARKLVQLQARLKQKKKWEKKKSPFYFRNDKPLERRQKKETPKGTDPKVQVRQESETSRYAATFQMDQRYAWANVDGGPPVMAS